jgi:hypothetical protein
VCAHRSVACLADGPSSRGPGARGCLGTLTQSQHALRHSLQPASQTRTRAPQYVRARLYLCLLDLDVQVLPPVGSVCAACVRLTQRSLNADAMCPLGGMQPADLLPPPRTQRPHRVFSLHHMLNIKSSILVIWGASVLVVCTEAPISCRAASRCGSRPTPVQLSMEAPASSAA